MQHKAVAERRTDIVHILLQNGAESKVADAWGTTPLFEALQLSDVATAKVLCARGAQIPEDADIVPMIVNAAESDEAILTVMCTAAGIDVNVRDMDGQTPLHIA